MSKRAVAALFLSQLLAGVLFAQSVEPPAGASPSSEFGRVSGGQIDLITKHSRSLSGSLGIGLSRSLPFATGANGMTNRYDATLGGTLLQDRLWFFGSAQQSDPLFASQYATTLPPTATPDRAVSRAMDTKMTAQLGDRQSLAASFAATRGSVLTPAATLIAPNPSSFLSLHYTGIVSDRMFFSGSFSRGTVTQPQFPLATIVPQQ